MFQNILLVDKAVSVWMLAFQNNLIAQWFFWAVSFSSYVAIACVIYYYWFIKRNKKILAKFSIGTTIVLAITELLKLIFQRPRPNLSDSLSFPSSHVALAFFIAFFLPVKIKYRVLLIVWAILVALSRLLLMEHWLSDVIFGAGIGIVTAYLVKTWKLK